MDDKQLQAFMALLTPEQLADMKKLIDETPAGKLVVPKSNKGKGKKPKVTPVVEETEEEIEEPITRTRRVPRGRKQADGGKQRKAGDGLIPKGNGVRTATSNIPLGKRPNSFIKSEFFDSAKGDVEIDRKLWGNKRPAARDRISTVESTCKICGTIEDVAIALAGKIEGDDTITHTCTRCSTGKRG